MSEGANTAKLTQGFSMQQYSVCIYVHTLFAGVKNSSCLLQMDCKSADPPWPRAVWHRL